MSTRFKGFALLAILVCSIGVVPVFAASPALLNNTGTSPSATSGNTGEITVTTDKTSYNDGDKVMISGSTQDYISDTPITVIIMSPIGNIVKIDQVDLGSDRTFSTSIMATGALWQAAGAYTVKVQFGSPDRTARDNIPIRRIFWRTRWRKHNTSRRYRPFCKIQHNQWQSPWHKG